MTDPKQHSLHTFRQRAVGFINWTSSIVETYVRIASWWVLFSYLGSVMNLPTINDGRIIIRSVGLYVFTQLQSRSHVCSIHSNFTMICFAFSPRYCQDSAYTACVVVDAVLSFVGFIVILSSAWGFAVSSRKAREDENDSLVVSRTLQILSSLIESKLSRHL